MTFYTKRRHVIQPKKIVKENGEVVYEVTRENLTFYVPEEMFNRLYIAVELKEEDNDKCS